MSGAPDGYVTQSPDTSWDIETRLIEHWRAASSADKFRMMSEVQRAADHWSRCGIRHRHPECTEDELRLRLAGLKYGSHFMIDIHGRDLFLHGR